MVVQVSLWSGGTVSRSQGLFMNNKQLSDLKRIIYRPSDWASPTLALLYCSLHLKRFLLFFIIAPSFRHVRYHLLHVWSGQAEENGWLRSTCSFTSHPNCWNLSGKCGRGSGRARHHATRGALDCDFNGDVALKIADSWAAQLRQGSCSKDRSA